MFGVFYSDIVNIIIADFDPADVYQLKCVDKYHFNYVTNDFIHSMIIKNIIKKLREKLGANYDNFVMAMEKLKIRISGSFVVQCALNEYWEESDIDLYTHSPISANMFDWTDGSQIYSRRLYGGIPNILSIINFHEKPVFVPGQWHVVYKLFLQMIKLERSPKHPTIWSHIDKTYDYDICKNVYKIKNGKPTLKISNLSSIMNKEIQIDINNIGKNDNRDQKYINRGFIFRKGRHDYIKYMRRVVPIVYCNVQDDKMSNIYFLGKRMRTNKWRNDNVTIKYFNKDMYSEAYTCHHSGLAHSYDKKGNILIKTPIYSRNSILCRCPIDNYYDSSLYEHRHTTMTMRKKGNKQEYFCEVIVIKCKHPITKEEYQTEDTYEWLDIEGKDERRMYPVIHLGNNRDVDWTPLKELDDDY
uniref:Uncharacterized protein n=1 Tax=viral metagenome TaxID=1070528 RepID=A0A6C0C8V1_9ZZZZ